MGSRGAELRRGTRPAARKTGSKEVGTGGFLRSLYVSSLSNNPNTTQTLPLISGPVTLIGQRRSGFSEEMPVRGLIMAFFRTVHSPHSGGLSGYKSSKKSTSALKTTPCTKAGSERNANCALTPLPRRLSNSGIAFVLGGQFVESPGEHGRHRSDLQGRRTAADDPKRGCGRGTGRHGDSRGICCDAGTRCTNTHSGMFPCFLAGRLERLVRSARSALITATRVAAGSMTPSSSPRSAARKGLATL
jgi:hypothetical protein